MRYKKNIPKYFFFLFSKLVERLDNVEAELHLGTNMSTIQKIADDLRNVTDVLNILNETVKEKIVSDKDRFENIESRTEELETLKTQVEKLSNDSHLMLNEFSDLWNNVKSK